MRSLIFIFALNLLPAFAHAEWWQDEAVYRNRCSLAGCMGTDNGAAAHAECDPRPTWIPMGEAGNHSLWVYDRAHEPNGKLCMCLCKDLYTHDPLDTE